MDFDEIKERFDAVQNYSENACNIVTQLLGSMRKHAQKNIPFKQWHLEHIMVYEELNIYLSELGKSSITYEELKFVYSKLSSL